MENAIIDQKAALERIGSLCGINGVGRVLQNVHYFTKVIVQKRHLQSKTTWNSI